MNNRQVAVPERTAARAGDYEVKVDGGSLAVELRGTGFPILFIHGWGLDRRVWRPQIEALSARFQTIAWDRRGFGLSTAPGDLTLEPGDIEVVTAAFGLDRYAIVGMSQGCRVAVSFAASHPETVAALVLQGSPLTVEGIPPCSEPAIPLSRFAELVRAGELDELRATWRSHPLLAVASAEAETILDQVIADYAGRDLKGAPAMLPLSLATASQLKMPVLVLFGDAETDLRKWIASQLCDVIPQVQNQVVKSGGHLCNLDNPTDYNWRLERFISYHGSLR